MDELSLVAVQLSGASLDVHIYVHYGMCFDLLQSYLGGTDEIIRTRAALTIRRRGSHCCPLCSCYCCLVCCCLHHCCLLCYFCVTSVSLPLLVPLRLPLPLPLDLLLALY